MGKDLFLAILIVEFLSGLLMMGLLFSDVGALIYPIASLVFVVVLSLFFKHLKKETDEEKKKKMRRTIVMIMFVPMAIGLSVIAYVVVSLMMYF